MEQNNFTRKDLELWIKEIYGFETIPTVFVSQTERFITRCKLSYKDIACTLCYMEQIGVLDKSPEKAKLYGMSKVPDFVLDARKFFQEKREREEKQREAIQNQQTTVIRVSTQNAETKHKGRKFIDIEKLINGGM